jgi:hypothetical protein
VRNGTPRRKYRQAKLIQFFGFLDPQKALEAGKLAAFTPGNKEEEAIP